MKTRLILVTDPLPLDWCCSSSDLKQCVCGPEERVLRAYASRANLPAMTSEQRQYCLAEIASVEGYRRADYEAEEDADLARSVLSAWTDFCRDKGLL